MKASSALLMETTIQVQVSVTMSTKIQMVPMIVMMVMMIVMMAY